jgi:cytoskeleton protein RodZ
LLEEPGLINGLNAIPLLLIGRSDPSTTDEMAKVTRLSLDNNGELDRRRLNFREISGDADAPLESVGQDLRKARERKGEELDHISRLLKIRRDYLTLIEEGDAHLLPGRAYAIGFVRSYATYLGLNGEEYVERLKAEIAGRGDNKEVENSAPSPEYKWLQGQWLVGGLLLVALLYAGYYLIVSATQLSEQPVKPVPERLAAEAGLPPASASASAPPAVAALPAPTAPVAAVSPAAQAPAPTLPPGRTYGVQNTSSRITLRVHRQTPVTVAGANNRMFINRLLQPGDTYLVPNLTGLRLSVPDSGAVELLLDGNSVGFAGQNGVATNGFPLNPQELSARRNNG